jgi:hypothetical protein
MSELGRTIFSDAGKSSPSHCLTFEGKPSFSLVTIREDIYKATKNEEEIYEVWREMGSV